MNRLFVTAVAILVALPRVAPANESQPAADTTGKATTWKYIERIGKLFQNYNRKDVAFLAIRSSLTDSEDRIRRYAEDKNLDMPLLYDEENRVADCFGTQGTPYFYVIDKQCVLRYEGICDNNQLPTRVDLEPETVTSHYVRDAIEAVLAGKSVKTKSVPTGSTRPQIKEFSCWTVPPIRAFGTCPQTACTGRRCIRCLMTKPPC